MNRDQEVTPHDVHEIARRIAQESPAVPSPSCPDHEGHSPGCYGRGWSDGFYEALKRAKDLIESGAYKDIEEVYEYYHEGQTAT